MSRNWVVGLLVGIAVGGVWVPAAAAAPSGSMHSFPGSLAAGVTRLCGPSAAYACTTGGYAGQSTGWWGTKYGAGYASSNAYGYHNCVLYAAFKVAQNGVGDPGWSDNANGWDTGAYNHGVPVDQSPAVGAIAQWNGGSAGHVAYVEAVGAGYIELTDDNYGSNVTNRWRINSGSAAWPDNFIHFHDLTTNIADGAFVSVSGHSEVYRVAGGAPLYVSNWGSMGGPQAVTVISQQQFDGMRPVPADGTFIASTANGRVYEVAGGAPQYISAADASKVPGWGSKPVIGVDQWVLDNTASPLAHLRQYPADGTLISNVADGRVYVVAGGAPEYISAADAAKIPGWGARPVTALSFYEFAQYEHLRQYPADGTLISNVADGRAYVVAGGAPEYISAADAAKVPGWGSRPMTVLSFYEFAQYEHLRRFPADGTLISNVADGRVYVVAGGAPQYITSGNASKIPGWGARPVTGLSFYEFAQYEHLRRQPADGTFVNTTSNRAYRFAGGAAFYITNWSIFGGTQPFTWIDQWAVDSTSDPVAHVLARPADGTLVRGLPSGAYWSFAGGYRSPAPANPAATTVDDYAIAQLPLKPTSATLTSTATGRTVTRQPSTSGSSTRRITHRRARALRKCKRIHNKKKRARCVRKAKKQPR